MCVVSSSISTRLIRQPWKMDHGSDLMYRPVLRLLRSPSSRWIYRNCMQQISSRSRFRETLPKPHRKPIKWTCLISTKANQNNSLRYWETLRSRLMEPEIQLHLFGLIAYIRCYVGSHWGSSTRYSLNTVVWPIITSILYRSVYSSIFFLTMHFPSKSVWLGAQFVNLEAWPSSVLRKGWQK